MLYILGSIIAILAIVGISGAYLLLKKNWLLTNLQREHSILQQQYSDLSKTHNSILAENNQLNSDNQYQRKLIQEFQQLKQEANAATKAALFELGGQLSKQLIDIHKQETQESRLLAEQKISATTSKFNSEFERLVSMVGAMNKEMSQSRDTIDIIKNSLLTPSGAGALAEITLENILQASGLRRNVDFNMQYSMQNIESNSQLRPDAIVFLPAQRLMVVDAKASKFLMDEADNQQKLAQTMNMHLRSLSTKSYAQNLQQQLKEQKIAVRDIVTLMFLPSEHAIEKLSQADGNFMDRAWQANIFPVGPAGLINMLSFAKFQISEQLMINNHLDIVDEVKKLIGSIQTLTEHSTKLGNSLSSATNHFDKFAASFNRNFLAKAKRLNEMGVGSADKKAQLQSVQRMQVVLSKTDLIDV